MTPDEFAEYREQLTRTVRTQLELCAAEGCVCGNQCVVWTGAVDRSGYGSFKLKGKVRIVHRYVYERLVGELTRDVDIDHLCKGHRTCCNVHHMEPVTRSENSQRANRRRWQEGYRHGD